MTVDERIWKILEDPGDLDKEKPASAEKMIFVAYYLGREAATKNMMEFLKKQINASPNSRMVWDAIGDFGKIQKQECKQEVSAIFGEDPADI